MAFRGGRGRGRGFGRGDFRFAKQESFVLFPDIDLPAKSKIDENELKLFAAYNRKFRQHFDNSPYFLEESHSGSKEENFDIERYSHKAKRTTGPSRVSLSSSGYLILEPGNFPIELLQGTKSKTGKKVRWTQKQDLRKLDFLEQLEEKLMDQETSGKKEDEEDDEDEENIEEDDEESDQGDYEQGQDYDDDEDDYNMEDDGDDEAIM